MTALGVAYGVGVGLSGLAKPALAKDLAASAVSEPSKTQPYTVTIDVSRDESLEEFLLSVSRMEILKDEPPATIQGVRQRLDVDLTRFENALRSRGYYASNVQGTINPPERDGKPASVVVNVDPGPLYTLSKVTLEYRDEDGASRRPRGAEIAGLTLGAPAEASRVIAGDERVSLALQRDGFPFAKVVDRLVIVDHANRTMEVTYIVLSGPWATFGPLQVSGNTGVKSDFFQTLRPWEIGTPYTEEEIRTFRRRLSESRLFSTIELGPVEPLDDKGQVPVDLKVTEASPRTLSGGLSYGTDSSFSTMGRWEHRNFLGRGELFRVSLIAGFTEQTGSVYFRKPYFMNPRQSLTASASLGRKDYDAYSGYESNVTVGIERALWDHWHASAGVLFDLGRLTWPELDNSRYVNHMLGGVPLQVARDDTDSLLDPTMGTRLSFLLTPYSGVVNEETSTFVSMSLTGSGYVPLLEDRLVLAGRARIAGIAGADLDLIPPNRRLYAGGGGSVRGFGYQMIGPLGPRGDPIGGRSAVDGGIEMRIKVTDTIGLVPFIEAGMVGADSFPTFKETPRVGAGLGARYYTDFGPVRVDFGVPLNRRRQDDRWQIYVSLGQAF